MGIQKFDIKLTVDMEGGWAYPIKNIKPNSGLTKQLSHEFENIVKLIGSLNANAQSQTCVVFVYDSLIQTNVDSRVNDYIKIHGMQHKVLAERLFNLKKVCKWLVESTAVKIGFHSFDHSNMYEYSKDELNEVLLRAEFQIQKLTYQYKSNRFINLMVFPMNIYPDVDLTHFQNWIFRIGRARNPQKCSSFSNLLLLVFRDKLYKNIIFTQSYIPLKKSPKNSILIILQIVRRYVGLGLFPWIHAWELDNDNYKKIFHSHFL